LTQTRFATLEKAHGLNANPSGILAPGPLRRVFDPVATLTHDWVHSALHDGMFSEEINSILKAMEPLGVRPADVRSFFADPAWRFPAASRAKAATLYRVFDSHRNFSGEDAKLKRSAAELLGLYGLMRHFVHENAAGLSSLSAQKESFEPACRCLDMARLAKRGVADPREVAQRLEDALATHLRLHILAYGTSGVRPKHHWMLHIPRSCKEMRWCWMRSLSSASISRSGE